MLISNQQIRYENIISTDKIRFHHSSSWGVDFAAYKFDTAGIIIPKVTIDAILFQPIEPVEDDFKILVKA